MQAHLPVGLLLLTLVAACGDGPDPAVSDEEPTLAPDNWQFHRDLEPGDCINGLDAPLRTVSCEGDEWYARVYEVIRGDDVSKRGCLAPDPYRPGFSTGFTVPDPPFVTLCMELREDSRVN